MRASCRAGSFASEWFFDPQTSGGLLKREHADATLAQLREHFPDAAVIGEVIPADGGSPMIELVS